MSKICFLTLGCKVNKYESDCMANIAYFAGYEVSSKLEFADIYVLNTCAVTNEGEKKSRQEVSKVLAINPNAKIIVCGCASQKNIEQFKSLNVFSGFGTINKENFLNYINFPQFDCTNLNLDYDNLHNPYISSTRAYIKIQDGCNRFCSYCIIPYIRGRSRSRDLKSIINEANILSKTNKEIVLVGIDLSDYKEKGIVALPKLLSNLKNVPAQIRLGSLEVSAITNEFMEVIYKMPNFAPQFHLSLQSGDDEVLKQMNRKYTLSSYEKAVNLIRRYFPLANITTDIIVGFPSETEKNFNNTCEFVKKIGFGKVHIFPYSKRSGTLASKMKDLSKEIKKDRVNKLEVIANNVAKEFHNKWLNKECDVLLEDIEGNYFVGYSKEYIKIYILNNERLKSGKIIRVVLKNLFNEGLIGEEI